MEYDIRLMKLKRINSYQGSTSITIGKCDFSPLYNRDTSITNLICVTHNHLATNLIALVLLLLCALF